MGHRWLVAAVGTAVGIGAPIGAQAQPGSAVLGNGLSRRVIELDNGIAIQRSTTGIDAGYFRVRVTPVGLGNIRCPKVAFKNGASRQQWQQTDQAIYDIVFRRNVIWSITARVAVGASGGGTASQEIPLVLIKNPNDSGCQISALIDSAGLAVDLSDASFLVPVASANPVYAKDIQLILNHAYTIEPDKQRVEAAWTGIQTVAKVIAAPFGAAIGALSGQGTELLNQKLSRRGTSSVPYLFPADPGGAKAGSYFVYLGFEAGAPDPATPTAGVQVQADYQATMFRAGRFYNAAMPLTAQEILTVQPIRIRQGEGLQDKTVRDMLPQAMWDQLAMAASPVAFDVACSILQPELRKIGLSDVDKDAFLWAAAESNGQLAGKLRELKCLNGDVQQRNLAKLGIKLPDAVPAVLPGLRPKKDDMHAAMDNLVTMMRVGSVVTDLTGRFADTINLVLIDDALIALAPTLPGLGRDRAAVLDFMARSLARGGCYVPRDDETKLPLRPLAPLAANARAGAMIAETAAGDRYIVSLGFDPAPAGERPKVSTISIQSQGASADDVVQDLKRGTSDICPKP